MNRVLLIILMAFVGMTMEGQTYTALWQQADNAAKQDLPRTRYDVLMSIVEKAQKEKQYGQLIAAELAASQTKTIISPDSLKPALERLETLEEQAKDEVLRAIYDAVLGYIYERNGEWLDDEDGIRSRAYYDKALARPDLLAQTKALDFTPFVVKGENSDIYGGDLLSVIAYEARRYDVLRDYYLKQGQNRKAMLMSSLMALNQELADKSLVFSSYGANAEGLERIDSLIACYADLPEVGEAVIERYDYMSRMATVTDEQRWKYLCEALERYQGWPRLNTLRNRLKEMEQKSINATIGSYVTIPHKSQTVKLNLQGISRLTMHVYRISATAQQVKSYSLYNDKDYKKLKGLATELPEQAQSRTYAAHQPWETYQDTLTLGGLPVGVYMITFETNIGTQPLTRLYHVTNLSLISQKLPNEQMRLVVVNADSGQPVKGAQLSIEGQKRNAAQTVTLTTDAKGECTFDCRDFRVQSVWLTTADDKTSPALSVNGYFWSYENESQTRRADVFTDRAIYRPGQTVHAAAIFYKTTNGFEHEVLKGSPITMRLRDANYEIVSEQTLTTDDYGTCAADFTLPRQGLTGRFSVEADGQNRYFNVEEYKRPTFEVEIPVVEEDYADGDTLHIKGTARTYSGVPVLGAKVKYRVERRRAYWWRAYSSYWNQGIISFDSEDDVLETGETMTDGEGSFTVPVTLVLPQTRFPMFYNFVIMADVTDQGGETHHGELSLPLGNRKTAFSMDMPQKVLAEKGGAVAFHLRNAAGTELEAEVRYRMLAADAKNTVSWQTAATNKQVALAKMKSGLYTLEAICGEDTLKQDFTVFSLDDKRPAAETHDWFYVSDTQFPNDGQPVTVQVGSSDKDVHIVYAILSGNTVIESGAVDKSNELINRKFTYRESYGNGLLLNFAWVKDGHVYTHQATIRRPLPDKQLKMEWQTFRNRLTPGQQEEWTLIVKAPSATGKAGEMQPAKAQMLATLYDKSLDQLQPHQWSLVPYVWLPIPNTSWSSASWGSANCYLAETLSSLQVPELKFNAFNHELYPEGFMPLKRYFSASMRSKAAMVYDFADDMEMAVPERAMAKAVPQMKAMATADNGMVEEAEMEETVAGSVSAGGEQNNSVQVRENLQETAFFYPQLTTDDEGRVSLKFTLPESLTTWRFLGLAHTQEMMVGMLTDEAVAKKDVMVQPNMPRFVRVGDQATISARIFNTSEQPVSGTMRLELIDPETEKVIFAEEQPVTVEANGSFAPSVQFICSEQMPHLLIAKCVVSGEGFSDGEQHYLPVLPNQERVTLTVPFTQVEPGTKTIDLAALKPQTADPRAQVTVEYTNNPAWLMIQALPAIGHPYDQCALCQASAFYANAIGRHILSQNPNAKQVFETWRRESASLTPEQSLASQLGKNQELKDVVLAETPWVADANSEAEQREQLADFFDENMMNMRLKSALDQLESLQGSDGSWSWWKGMHGSLYMTIEISEMLVRLNQMTAPQEDTRQMLDKAFKFVGNEMVKMVDDLKQQEKKGQTVSFPSHTALQWLYVCTLDGRQLSAKVQSANDYLLKLLKKDTRNQSIYDKAMSAIVLNNQTYIKSLKEYTVYREEMGRYYDTPRALYSWRNYRIPTQVAAIEAIQRLTPEDTQTISEMQRWLLQEKHTQMWDTPVNSADAIYAFLNGNSQTLAAQPKTVLKMDGADIPTSEATAGIGYVKTTLPLTPNTNTLTAEKTSEGTSWGAVYMQFMQPVSDIQEQQSGISVKREIVSDNRQTLKVGDRIKVRLTIEADRDYDFVQVIDKRAACMEPVNQLSGYHYGYYCAPKDCSTNYFFDLMAKGKHVIETEYYIDRVGIYETGTCTVGCAYSPEFHGTAKSMTITVTE